MIDLPPTRTGAIDVLVATAFGQLRSTAVVPDAARVYDYLVSEAKRGDEGAFVGVDEETRDDILLAAKSHLAWISGSERDLAQSISLIESLLPQELGGKQRAAVPLKDAVQSMVQPTKEVRALRARLGDDVKAVVAEVEVGGKAEVAVATMSRTDSQLWANLKDRLPADISPAQQLKVAEAARADCAKALASDGCRVATLLEQDAKRRETGKALGEKSAALQQTGDFLLQALAAAGRPDLARWASSAVAVGRAGKEISDVMNIVGPLVTMNWLAIGTSVLGLGNSLGGMFGGGGDDALGAQRHAEIMQALDEIKEQLTRLRLRPTSNTDGFSRAGASV